MQFRGVVGLFLTVLTFQNINSSIAFSAVINRSLEASVLKKGYFIRLLKPLPRRNSGCETIFRSGEVLESCDPNYGIDPSVDGVVRNYCEWNLHTHFQKNNSAEWLEPYFNPNLIVISNAKVGYGHHDENRTYIQKLRNIENIIYRWIEIEFKDQITGSKLGSLKCYPSKAYEAIPGKQKLFGRYSYRYDESIEENEKEIKSGLNLGNISDQLAGYAEIIKQD